MLDSNNGGRVYKGISVMSRTGTTQTHASEDRRRDSIFDFYNLIVAVFLFVSPWLFAYASSAARLDFWASGALVALVSIAAIVAYSEWEELLNLALGLWLMAAPWLTGFAHTKAAHVSLGVGIVIAYLAALELWLAHYYDATSA